MSRKQTAVILCEDTQASTLLYRYLRHERGFHRVTVCPLPAGQKCASQYVREHYAAEVAKQRDRRVASVLVVHTDADNLTVAARKKTLADALTSSNQSPRDPEEEIALVIPRWETENWPHHYLGGKPVTETATYPKFSGRERDAARATIRALVLHVDGKEPLPPNLPSVGESVAELRRLP